MTRNVVDNHMVAHLWANQSQSEARSHNGNFWFRDTTLYSYSTPIANIVGGVVLVTSASYSTTTNGKHKHTIGRATRYTYFTVPNLLLGAGVRLGRYVEEQEPHKANLAYLEANYETILATFKRARDIYYAPLERLEAEYKVARDYARAFALETVTRDPQADSAALMAYRAEREAKRNTPAYAAKQAKAKVRREAALAEKARLERATKPVATSSHGARSRGWLRLTVRRAQHR